MGFRRDPLRSHRDSMGCHRDPRCFRWDPIRLHRDPSVSIGARSDLIRGAIGVHHGPIRIL
eukprot:5127110-Pyramimonas_sp.AAC.1